MISLRGMFSRPETGALMGLVFVWGFGGFCGLLVVFEGFGWVGEVFVSCVMVGCVWGFSKHIILCHVWGVHMGM